MLDTEFHDGQRFLNTWQAWTQDPCRPRFLHYVGVALLQGFAPVSSESLEAPERQLLAQELSAQCQGLGPGFHRITLAQGAVSLTLCFGPVDAMLGEHAFQADTLWASAPSDKWAAQLLARRCKRGTRFCLARTPEALLGAPPHLQLTSVLNGAGFELDETVATSGSLSGRFNPQWQIPSSRNPARQVAPAPARCAVIGAGLAGASVAHALALRGWRVTVLDQESSPAGGASGLPAGLAVPHVSTDDSPRSRLTRSGIRLMAQHAHRLLAKEQDWEQCGVLERRPDGPALWHPQAAWVKPYRLVQAWLAQAGITFVGNTKIAKLRCADSLWWLGDVQGKEIGPFEVVVVANALGCSALLKCSDALSDKLSALQSIHGTLSHGTYAETIPDLPATPVNGRGCFIPHVPDAAGEQWCIGSTFEPDALAAADIWTQHASNMKRLQHLIPDVGLEIAETLDRGPVSQWSATRCVTHDRLPLVGPAGTDQCAGLWLCVGMGSRGLSFAALCAELLVARLCAEPLPMEVSLSRSLDANRVRHKRRPRGNVQYAA